MTASPATTPYSVGRMFPVHQAGAVEWRRRIAAGEKLPPWPRAVPWAMLRGREARVMANHNGADLAALAARGGLRPAELVAVLEDRPAGHDGTGMTDSHALTALHRMLDAWEERHGA